MEGQLLYASIHHNAILLIDQTSTRVVTQFNNDLLVDITDTTQGCCGSTVAIEFVNFGRLDGEL